MLARRAPRGDRRRGARSARSRPRPRSASRPRPTHRARRSSARSRPPSASAARGGDALVLIDSLDGLHPHVARKVLATARNLADGGSLTVIATATRPFGGETTVIALDVALTSAGGCRRSTSRPAAPCKPELLVGEDGAEAIAKARASALEAAG